MTKKIAVKNENLIGINKDEIAVRIVGATLNEDLKTLDNLLKTYEKNDEITFCILSGFLKILSKENSSLHTIMSSLDDHHFYQTQSVLHDLLSKFDTILNKREYHNYAAASMPTAGITKEVFLEKSLLEILHKLFTEVLSGDFSRHDGGDAFIVSNNIKLLIVICLGYEIVTEDCKKGIRNVFSEALDKVYIADFSSAKSKVWDARRSALDYFIKQLFIFNDSFLKEEQNFVFRRWKAWFLLEDKYKIEGRKVVRKNLRIEMLQIFRNV